jgi:hypothetical protein
MAYCVVSSFDISGIIENSLGGTLVAKYKRRSVFVSFDIETSGPRTGYHDMLSLGAHVVHPGILDTIAPVLKYSFYAEMKPLRPQHCVPEAIAVCGSQFDAAPYYANTTPDYWTRSCTADVLRMLREQGRTPKETFTDLGAWLEDVVPADARLVPIVDTVFFDSPWLVHYWQKELGTLHPFGWSGLDLDSYLRGKEGREARLSDFAQRVGLKNVRNHNALWDAWHSARIAHCLLTGERPSEVKV